MKHSGIEWHRCAKCIANLEERGARHSRATETARKIAEKKADAITSAAKGAELAGKS